MRRTLPLAALVAVFALGLPGRARAQQTWISGWGGVLMDPATIHDDESGTYWDFGTSLMLGATVQRELGALTAGVEVAYSPVKHEVQDENDRNVVLYDGRAHLVTAMLTGKLGAGGGGSVSTYLTGGVGTMVFGIPGLDRWDPDLALRGGGGLEYRASSDLALFLEWNRWWVFHQTEGVDDNTVRDSHLEIGLRFGL